LAEFFAAVLKTEQGGGWLLTEIALSEGGAERQITIKQNAFLLGILDMASGIQRKWSFV